MNGIFDGTTNYKNSTAEISSAANYSIERTCTVMYTCRRVEDFRNDGHKSNSSTLGVRE